MSISIVKRSLCNRIHDVRSRAGVAGPGGLHSAASTRLNAICSFSPSALALQTQLAQVPKDRSARQYACVMGDYSRHPLGTKPVRRAQPHSLSRLSVTTLPWPLWRMCEPQAPHLYCLQIGHMVALLKRSCHKTDPSDPLQGHPLNPGKIKQCTK